MQGKIVKGVGGRYSVAAQGEIYECAIRGAIRREDRICVGDEVCFDAQARVIERILPRKNFLLRPGVANVDQLLFVIAPSPKPDFLLLDKILIRCLRESVPVLLGINKSDLFMLAFSEAVCRDYAGAAERILLFSAKTGENLEKVRAALEGKLTCLCGQSAVGKSSLLNALFPHCRAEVGGLSSKTERGRHTTRHSEIFGFGKILLCDTPGFSSFELEGIGAESLADCYPEYAECAADCRFRGCTHDREPDCEVKRRVESGALGAERYARYLELLHEIKRRKKYE